MGLCGRKKQHVFTLMVSNRMPACRARCRHFRPPTDLFAVPPAPVADHPETSPAGRQIRWLPVSAPRAGPDQRQRTQLTLFKKVSGVCANPPPHQTRPTSDTHKCGASTFRAQGGSTHKVCMGLSTNGDMLDYYSGEQNVALLLTAALEISEERSSACAKLRPVEAQPASEMFGVRRGCGVDRLDRISNGICERAVRLQLRDFRQLVRLSVAREFRPQIADLREQIRADILSLSD